MMVFTVTRMACARTCTLPVRERSSRSSRKRPLKRLAVGGAARAANGEDSLRGEASRNP